MTEAENVARIAQKWLCRQGAVPPRYRMPKGPRESAADAFARNEAEFTRLQKTLQRKFKQFKREFEQKGSTRWDYVGSLSYWVQTLREMLGEVG